METKEIALTQIDYQSRYHRGFGAGDGEVITITYECPCGKGTIVYEKDDIPAFRSRDIYCQCKDCIDLYTFDKGVAKKK